MLAKMRDDARRPLGRPRGLGLGAAWNEEESLGLGLPFPSTGERFERLEEALLICLQMWSDNDGPFEGSTTGSAAR